MTSDELHLLRQWYSEEIQWSAGITDEAITAAFACVPREKFLPPGPWLFSTEMIAEAFRSTPDATPRHLYHNVVVAIDPARDLSTALPSYMAAFLERAALKQGARVAHIGAGLGYYTAIISKIIGDAGCVLALELDRELAARATSNLAPYSNVQSLCADGSSYSFPRESFDVVIVSAGASQIQSEWLTSLSDGGRLMVPLTFSDQEPGQVARIMRFGSRFRIEFVMDAMVYPCAGSDDPRYAHALREAVETYGWYDNAELRVDVENADESAWLATPTYWISMIEYDWTAHSRIPLGGAPGASKTISA